MAYSLSPFIFNQYFDNVGVPLNGGLLYFYESGTSTPKAVYQSITGVAHTNPVVLDASGRPGGSGAIFLGEGAYKAILRDRDGLQLAVVDGIIGASSSSSTTATVVDLYADLRALTSNPPVVWVRGRTSIADGGEGFFYYDPSITVSDNDCTILMTSTNPITGRYVRDFSGSIDPRWIGLQYNTQSSQRNQILALASVSSYHRLPVQINQDVFLALNTDITYGIIMDKGARFIASGNINVTFKTGSSLTVDHNQPIVNEYVSLKFESTAVPVIRSSWQNLVSSGDTTIAKLLSSSTYDYTVEINNDITITSDFTSPSNIVVTWNGGVLNVTTPCSMTIAKWRIDSGTKMFNFSVVPTSVSFPNERLSFDNIGMLATNATANAVAFSAGCKHGLLRVTKKGYRIPASISQSSDSVDIEGGVQNARSMDPADSTYELCFAGATALGSLTISGVNLNVDMGSVVAITNDFYASNSFIKKAVEETSMRTVGRDLFIKDSVVATKSQIIVNSATPQSEITNSTFDSLSSTTAKWPVSKASLVTGSVFSGFTGNSGSIYGIFSDNMISMAGILSVFGQCLITGNTITSTSGFIPLFRLSAGSVVVVSDSIINNPADGYANPLFIGNATSRLIVNSLTTNSYCLTNGIGKVENHSKYYFPESTNNKGVQLMTTPIDYNYPSITITNATNFSKWQNTPTGWTSNGEFVKFNVDTSSGVASTYVLSTYQEKLLKALGGVITITYNGVTTSGQSNYVDVQVYKMLTTTMIYKTITPNYNDAGVGMSYVQKLFVWPGCGIDDSGANGDNNVMIRLYSPNVKANTNIKITIEPIVPNTMEIFSTFWRENNNQDSGSVNSKQLAANWNVNDNFLSGVTLPLTASTNPSLNVLVRSLDGLLVLVL